MNPLRTSALLLCSLLTAPLHADEASDFFEKKIRPVLVESCYSCHSEKANKKRGGLYLDSRDAMHEGGDSGPVLKIGDAQSLILNAIRYEDQSLKMPPKGKLPDAVIADFEKWIKAGAFDPRVPQSSQLKKPEANSLVNHWSLQPIRKPAVPKVKDADWPITDIDRFVLAELEKKGMKPVGQASPTVLARRLAFDLTGLPPKDKAASAGSYLASPEFGERWARHWMDVARYADSTGGGANWVLDDAWRYRDWLIDAFNRDLAFDQFVTEQIAGDLIPQGQGILATGFLQMGPKELAEYDVERLRMDIADEQVDAVGRAFMGLTLGCARCHDHKFDPVPTAEYHALAGIFRSTTALGPDKAGPISQVLRRGLPVSAENAKAGKAAADSLKALQAELKAKQTELKKLKGPEQAKLSATVDGLQTQIAGLRKKVETLTPKVLSVLEETPADLPIFIRGDLNNKGPKAPRGFLRTAFDIKASPVNRTQSGRLELAQWIVSPDNPLTARVYVNRVWHWLFGAGLVASVDNFGIRGDAPSHPELLDYLAARFMEEGWSTKKLIHEIVRSRVYQLASTHDETSAQLDPDNRLLWRHSRRRLEAEEIRDAILFISGDLDPKMGGSTNTNTGRLGFESLAQKVDVDPKRRRSVYLPIYRGGYVPDLFQAFDFPDSGLITGRRNVTTVAPQALFLLNSEFMAKQSELVAKKLLAAISSTDYKTVIRLNMLHRLALGREMSAEEQHRCMPFVYECEKALKAQGRADAELAAWTTLCHAVLASNEFLFLE